MEVLKKYNPIFSHHNDLVAFAVHISFLQHECKLVGLSEEQYLEDIGSVPQGWNRCSDMYTFRYIEKNTIVNLTEKKQDQISTILVRILQLEENSLVISAIRSGNDKVFSLDLNVSDYINLDQKITSQNTRFDTMYKDFTALGLLIKERITYKTIPSEKSNEKEKEKETNNDKNSLIDIEEQPFDRPRYPNYYGSNRNRPRPYGGDFSGDLNPIPDGGIGGIGGGLMGPTHPRFGSNARGRGRGRGGMNPIPRVPDGARFDPIGPGSLGNYFGPDSDHMRPPRGDNDPYGMFL